MQVLKEYEIISITADTSARRGTKLIIPSIRNIYWVLFIQCILSTNIFLLNALEAYSFESELKAYLFWLWLGLWMLLLVCRQIYSQRTISILLT